MRNLYSRRTKAAALSAAVTVAALALAACGGSSGGASGGTASASVPTITLGSPGIPPVISGLLPYVAQKEGFYRKYGVNVVIRSFQTGTDATRAVAAGQLDAAIMPPALLMELACQGRQGGGDPGPGGPGLGGGLHRPGRDQLPPAQGPGRERGRGGRDPLRGAVVDAQVVRADRPADQAAGLPGQQRPPGHDRRPAQGGRAAPQRADRRPAAARRQGERGDEDVADLPGHHVRDVRGAEQDPRRQAGGVRARWSRPRSPRSSG